MAQFPPKPAAWEIFPRRGLLVMSKPMQPETNRDSGNTEGMTQIEKQKAENWAWFDMLAALAGTFDVCAWGDKTPFGLERTWELLASAYYIQMESGGVGTDGKLADVPITWIDEARSYLSQMVAGTISLMDASCEPIRPSQSRSGTPKIGISGGGLTVFPYGNDQSLDGFIVGGSVQEIQRLHGRASVSAYASFPVDA